MWQTGSGTRTNRTSTRCSRTAQAKFSAERAARAASFTPNDPREPRPISNDVFPSAMAIAARRRSLRASSGVGHAQQDPHGKIDRLFRHRQSRPCISGRDASYAQSEISGWVRSSDRLRISRVRDSALAELALGGTAVSRGSTLTQSSDASSPSGSRARHRVHQRTDKFSQSRRTAMCSPWALKRSPCRS